MLLDLTMEHLKQQVLQITQRTHASIIIMDGDGSYIETDESVIRVFKKDPVHLSIKFGSEDIQKSKMKKNEIAEALDFKKHWSAHWRKANAEAAKRVERMIKNKEEGLIIVAYNPAKWKHKNDGLGPIVNLVKNSKGNSKPFEGCYMYEIKRRVIVLKQVHIDGNVYAVDCELRCEGSVNITTQLFATKNAIINEQLKHFISPIFGIQKYITIFHYNFKPLKMKEKDPLN
ncbi:hypothetical protein RFI_10906 [Reticulomyxa filosa]|uniref:Uncharacterized protein n=1 Tax=Reticulomyxa filosa TaxID=46433 RepID=X6NJS0_RETFI|nr:hypothetical protein RFI_10906 [Reticulomyxa filosa]|eukprot:ETO26231.1 hypothetical protein RFI_10906 [Reticulomyxa filosa]